jgi:hypothetical protein
MAMLSILTCTDAIKLCPKPTHFLTESIVFNQQRLKIAGNALALAGMGSGRPLPGIKAHGLP